MKKFLGILITAVFILLPMTATADTITLDVDWSAPYYENYFVDYDGKIDGASSVEIFCVESEDAPWGIETYTLQTIDSLDYLQAAWVADQYAQVYGISSNDGNDSAKEDAQLAIWALTGVLSDLGLSNAEIIALVTDNTYYEGATDEDLDLNSYVFSINWALAVNDNTHWVWTGWYWSKVGYQDYLVPISVNPGDPVNPVPEPATLLLFGSGLFGLATFRRKMFKK